MPIGPILQIVLFGAIAALWIYFATAGWERYIAARPRIINRRWQAWAVAAISLLMAVGGVLSIIRN